MSFNVSLHASRVRLYANDDRPFFQNLEGLYQITITNPGTVDVTLVRSANTPITGYPLPAGGTVQFEIYGDGQASLYGKVSSDTEVHMLATRLGQNHY